MMEILLAVTLLGLLALVLAVVGIYNRVETLRNGADRAWANIDVLLQQRNDEVPNLVAAVRGYAAHERTLLASVTQARAGVAAAVGAAAKAVPSETLSAGVRRLIAVAEAYPRLQADGSFLALQKRLSALEDAIADRREHYNECVRLFNTRIAILPDAWVARRMGAVPREYFRADAGARVAPPVALAA